MSDPKVDSMRCTRCNQIKDASEFSPDSTRATGLYPHCKECTAAARRQRRENAIAKKEGRAPRDMTLVPKFQRPATGKPAPRKGLQINQSEQLFTGEVQEHHYTFLFPQYMKAVISPVDGTVTVYSKEGRRLFTLEPEPGIEVEIRD